jgi:hypothetical protein
MGKLHITGLFTLRRLFGGSGSEKPQSGFALCAVLSPPDFGNLQTQNAG